MRISCWLAIGLFIAAAVFAAEKPNPKKQSEQQAVASLRTLNAAEVDYYLAARQKGFGCTLQELAPQTPVTDPQDPPKIDEELRSGSKGDYSFAVSCPSEAKPHSVVQVIAKPINGKDLRTFCFELSLVEGGAIGGGAIFASDQPERCLQDRVKVSGL